MFIVMVADLVAERDVIDTVFDHVFDNYVIEISRILTTL